MSPRAHQPVRRVRVAVAIGALSRSRSSAIGVPGPRQVFAIGVLAALALVSLAFGQAAGQWRSPEHIWNASCGYCHGAGVARELRGLKLPADAIRQIVRRGSTAMPVFHASELSDADLSSLAKWLEAAPAPSPPPAQPPPPAPAAPSSP